jgi:hypothetical protein
VVPLSAEAASTSAEAVSAEVMSARMSHFVYFV